MLNSNAKMVKAKSNFVLIILAIAFAFILLLLSPVKAEQAKHYTDLKLPPLPEIKIPDYTRYQLDNGLTVFLMEDRELPLVSGQAFIKTGDRLEPGDQVGLANIMGEVMRSGGSKSHPAEQMNELLELRAAAVESSVDSDVGSVSFTALSEDLPEVFGLFAEVLREPIFPQDKIDLAKNQRRGAISRRNDDPNEIAGREFQKLIYGSESPYARTIEYQHLDNISRQDLLKFYQAYFHPNNIILGIVGDFNSQEMRSLIEQQLGNWKPNPNVAAINQSPPVLANPAKPGGIFFVNQPQLTQSYVQMGHLGGQLDSPDYTALSVLNGVLNGFGGRMFNKVRSEKGLAYSVYAYWSPRFDYPGIFLAGGQTRSEATVAFIQAVFSEIEQIRREPITQTELNYAKDSTLNSFVFNFQSPGQTLSRLMRYEYYNYPQDFIFQYQNGVEATTIADVQRVAEQYLQPDKIVTLVVGNDPAIQPPLSSLNPTNNVNSIDISIPEPQRS
ncbi:M16 family metallopeptidase [Planktothricoides raciborskii]|uniref:Pitrilysin family protein n=2 Tax=Planktothricoides raciborskii TaxID=132608 RepID=A0AAU8JJ69_9CYAN|nr:pitrilysin family protein [Planktothricoides raciborskii]MBD2547835.1 insulinase family protein [Planktothricoides raciborskii FACHB-1370]MBD2586279.1 insulinase family protein [Planktothricoides raciborskii FACHB-1261]